MLEKFNGDIIQYLLRNPVSIIEVRALRLPDEVL